ncbi:kelch-like protein 2 isoform X2 [Acyrthosiphon pisum]|uniref:Kelch-like protein diablo n=1 Tax=Acyrthosiphon pisum TaxID=7029 RepID=A0A8R2JRR0_ACYPI|nr:kelch-like protein 2 isoform X2 [Acyrthosiphon pisum]|eukprot:XP_001945164.2 PREDICTED: kelch-like protein 2 isoform X2 [Acyrthosiphon pisum]
MQNTKKIPEFSRCESTKYEYKKSSYAEIYDVLQSLRKDEILCDIKIEIDDGGVIFGHKVVLASASPYFHAMFTNFSEKNQDLVLIKELDSSALRLLIDFVYSGEISITEKNVQCLLPASNLLQLQEVKNACFDFLQAQLWPTNVIGINALADLHGSMQLLTSSELYIQQLFSDVVEGDEFLSFSSELMVKLISSDELTAPSEEKVFEIVIRWVKHDLDSRKQILPQLMEHVRLPLISKDYILKNIVDEPLLINCSKCKDYVFEALRFHLIKPDKLITIPHNIRTKARQSGGTHKVIFAVGGLGYDHILNTTEWYDPKINQWQPGPKMFLPLEAPGLAVANDNCVFLMGGNSGQNSETSKLVHWLDLSSESPHWRPTNNMLVKRQDFGVGVIDNHIYAIGGADHDRNYLNSAEAFDCRTQKWQMLASMSTRRFAVGIGVLNNLLYAVGGSDSKNKLSSVECYHPGLDKWTTIADMCVSRNGVGVGVLNGVLYAVGGGDGHNVHRSVEAYQPSIGVWTTIPEMHLCRCDPGVAVLDGLLYVIGGYDGTFILDSVEFYNPNTNTWSMVTAPMNDARFGGRAVAIDMPRYLKNC